jgi:hypothetical protein
MKKIDFIDEVVKKVLEESLEEKANSIISQIHERLVDDDPEERDMYDDEDSEVVGVYSNINKQRKEMQENIYGSFDSEEWYDKNDKPYKDGFDFDFDEEEIDSYDDLMSKYGKKQKWFAPERSDANEFDTPSDGRMMFNRYKDEHQTPLKIRKRRPMGEGEEMEEEEVSEGNAFSEARCKAICKGEKTFSVDGKQYHVKGADESDKKSCGCHKMNESKKTLTLTEDELISIIERLVKEQQESEGMKITNKALKDTKSENDEYLESVNKKMKEYLKDGSKETYEANPKHFPKGNGELGEMKKKAYKASKAVEDFIDNFAYSPGMENLQYDEIKPNDEWLEMNIEGSSKTGNNPDWANAVKTDLGKKINEKRKKNLYGKEKNRSYNRVTQPVDEAGEGEGEDSLDKMFAKLDESNDKKLNVLKNEMGKIKHLLGYNKKTQ